MSDVTDEMWKAAADAVIAARRNGAIRNDYAALAVLSAVLAGKTVVDLPEPKRDRGTGTPFWPLPLDGGRSEVAYSRNWDDASMEVETPHGNLSPGDAEAYALALLAAAREAKARLSSEDDGRDAPQWMNVVDCSSDEAFDGIAPQDDYMDWAREHSRDAEHGPAARALRRRMGDVSSDSVDDVVDTVWDVLNDRTNHGNTPYSYDDVAAAVRDALAGKQVSDG